MQLSRKESIDAIVSFIARAAMSDLNLITIGLVEFGIAASFSQYIPELHDDAETIEDSPTDNELVARTKRAVQNDGPRY